MPKQSRFIGEKAYINKQLKDFIDTGDENAFYSSLEIVVRNRENISEFSKVSGLGRTYLYKMFEGKRKPKLLTLMKIFKALGYSFKVT